MDELRINPLYNKSNLYIYIYDTHTHEQMIDIEIHTRTRNFPPFFVGPKREKSNNFKMNRSIKRFISFKELFISFLHTGMFPVCCFRQRTFNAFSGFVSV